MRQWQRDAVQRLVDEVLKIQSFYDLSERVELYAAVVGAQDALRGKVVPIDSSAKFQAVEADF